VNFEFLRFLRFLLCRFLHFLSCFIYTKGVFMKLESDAAIDELTYVINGCAMIEWEPIFNPAIRDVLSDRFGATDESQRYYDFPQTYLFLALGLKSRDQAAAHEAFQTAMQRIDPPMTEEPDYSSRLGFNGLLLPLVEQIDPELVPEFFWRAVATRPLTGNPRSVRDFPVSHLVAL
jgi:hypothetical protein